MGLGWGWGWGGLFLSLGRPSPEHQKSCLAAAGGFNYDAALQGATARLLQVHAQEGVEEEERALVERGFFVNRSRVLLGSGAATFLRAKQALLSWKHVAVGWAGVEPETPVKTGTRFCICNKELIQAWLLLPLQIAYVTTSSRSSTSLFGFGGGTLQGHLLAGEESFWVQLGEDGQVWYQLLSFSKPAHVLSAIFYPYVQLRQRQFARHSAHAILKHLNQR